MTMRAPTLKELVDEQVEELIDEEREARARKSAAARKGGGRKAGTSSMFPYGRRVAQEQRIADRTPAWAGQRPGAHPLLPLKPPGRS